MRPTSRRDKCSASHSTCSSPCCCSARERGRARPLTRSGNWPSTRAARGRPRAGCRRTRALRRADGRAATSGSRRRGRARALRRTQLHNLRPAEHARAQEQRHARAAPTVRRATSGSARPAGLRDSLPDGEWRTFTTADGLAERRRGRGLRGPHGHALVRDRGGPEPLRGRQVQELHVRGQAGRNGGALSVSEDAEGNLMVGTTKGSPV